MKLKLLQQIHIKNPPPPPVLRQVRRRAKKVQLVHRGERDRGADGPRGRGEVQDDAPRLVDGVGAEESRRG